MECLAQIFQISKRVNQCSANPIGELTDRSRRREREANVCTAAYRGQNRLLRFVNL